jgi:hypothetical protein
VGSTTGSDPRRKQSSGLAKEGLAETAQAPAGAKTQMDFAEGGPDRKVHLFVGICMP